MAKIRLKGHRCERCEHEWVPRATTTKDPKCCAKCKSPYWNVPRGNHVQVVKEANKTDIDGDYCKWCGYPKNNQHQDHKYEPNDCMDHWHVQVHGQGAHCRSCGMTSVFTPNGMKRVIPCASGPEYELKQPKDGYADLTKNVEPWDSKPIVSYQPYKEIRER